MAFSSTEPHLILVNVDQLGFTGKEAENMLEKRLILANRNAIPFDERPAHIGSGLRLGTTVLTILAARLKD